jgi:hypothetical protein
MTDRNQVLNINMLGCPGSSTWTDCGNIKIKAEERIRIEKRGNSTRDGICSRGYDESLVETEGKTNSI